MKSILTGINFRKYVLNYLSILCLVIIFLRKKSESLQLKLYSYIFSISEKVQEEQFKLYLSLTQSLHEMRRKNAELEEEIDRYDIYLSKHSLTSKEWFYQNLNINFYLVYKFIIKQIVLFLNSYKKPTTPFQIWEEQY